MTRPRKPNPIDWTTITARVTPAEDAEVQRACEVRGKEIDIPISKAQFMRMAILKEARRLINA